MPADDAGPAGLPARGVLALIRAYQLLFSPLFAGSCRFVPSCSAYAAEAVHQHGAFRGTMLALRRLARCRPFGGHGYDPVPASAPSALRRGKRPGRH
ncbi:MAG TPA: membrane protein insertion efficiency factor YidD [Vicinamibacterales bacterium]